MPRKRPETSGYARIAQAEEEEEEEYGHSDEDDPYKAPTTLSTPGSRYAPIQPKRHRSAMDASEAASPGRSRRPFATRPRRSNSGVDIKAINARLERWAEEIASKFKRRRRDKDSGEEPPEIQHSVFQAPDWIKPATAEDLAAYEAPTTKLSKVEFDDVVESVRVAIELGVHPKLISQGSSGSYFARNGDGKTVGVFKPKDEEPYASRNPKWTKWIHRNLFPFFFGRACLIPNLSYISEAAAYVLDTQLRTNIVPYTDIVSLSSKSFHYDFWDRRAYYRRRKPFPEKIGSFQYFLKGYKDATLFLKEHPWPDQQNGALRAGETRRKKRRRWTEDCRPGGARSDDEDDEEDDSRPQSAAASERPRSSVFWSEPLQQSFREQLEKLVILDYIMRNTDRGLDNWMIKIDQATQKASIVVDPPQDNLSDGSPFQNGHISSEADAYKRQQPMSAASRSATPSIPMPEGSVSLGAIDNSLSWPWKHPDAWRSYPFGWLFLPVSLIGQPFSERTRQHFLPLLTSKKWWADTQHALRKCFVEDADFQEKMYAKQMAVMKGQAWNVVETLKDPGHGPLELTRRTRVCVWDDIVEVPVVVPLRTASPDMRRHSQAGARSSANFNEQEEMDISAARDTPSLRPQPEQDLLALGSPPLEANRFNMSRQNSANNVRDSVDTAPLSPSAVQQISWSASADNQLPKSFAGNTRPSVYKSRMSYDGPRRNHHRQLSGEDRRRRFSFSTRRGSALNAAFGLGEDGDGEEDGDLGYSAAEGREGNRKKVIVERLETVKSKKPFFTWC